MSRDESEKKTLEELAIEELANDLKRAAKKEVLNTEFAKLITNSKRYKISKMFGNYNDEITIVFKKKKEY